MVREESAKELVPREIEEKCAVGRIPKVLGSPRRAIPETPQSSGSILRS